MNTVMTGNSSKEVESAWRQYVQALENAHDAIMNEPFVDGHSIERAQGLYMLQMLQAKAFNFYISPRRAFPALYSQQVFMPYELSWGTNCPDFIYRWSFLDGAHTYRLWGKQGTTRWVDLQVQNGWWGDTTSTQVGNFDLAKFAHAADGSFEVMLSANPHPGNWIKLDPAARNVVLNIREVYYDWENEQASELYIETLDRKPEEMILFDEHEIADRLRHAARLVDFYLKFARDFTNMVLKHAPGRNKMWLIPPEWATERGGNPAAIYAFMIYDIEPDEAMLIEVDIPKDAFYWSIMLGDLWNQTLDSAYSQSSLNGHSARVDADGKFRCVLSLKDPGVPNWIDASGLSYGLAEWRWYNVPQYTIPTAGKVKLADIRNHLPQDTPTVTTEQRKAQVQRRTRASLQRYGFLPKFGKQA